MKTLVLRFDIDTYRCISKGVPNLLDLARREDVAFSFFCNMGRAVSRAVLFRKLLKQNGSSSAFPTAHKLSPVTKLGYPGVLHTLLLNPKVGSSHPDILQRALEEGHDVGLHGGSNHGAWQYGFPYWSPKQIRCEVIRGRNMYCQKLGRSPNFFSSPGWRGSSELDAILQSMGFLASANRHGPNENDIVCKNGFYMLPTNLVSEPGGIAYFESLAAREFKRADITRNFLKATSRNRDLHVLYDHPLLAGISFLDIVQDIIRTAKQKEICISTYSMLLANER